MTIKTSLEDLGAATCKDFVDYKSLKSFGSPAEVQYNYSKCDTQTDGHTNIWTSRAAVAAKK